MRTRLAAAGLIALGTQAVAAQASACPAAAGAPYLVCQVDQRPRPDSTNVIPRYPELLTRVGTSGSIRFAIVVDSMGRVDTGSFAVVESSHVLMTLAVKTAVRMWRFKPALVAGRPVGVRWEQIVSFATPPDRAPLGDAQQIQEDTIDGGTPRLHVGVGTPQPDAITSFTAAELLEVQRQVLRLLAPAPAVDSAGDARVTLCVNVSRGSQEDAADSGTLAALSAPGRRAVIPRDCPKSYSGMLWTQERPPKGYVDPYAMTVARLGAWNTTVLVMRIDVAQGAGMRAYQCWAQRGTPTWRTQCKRIVATIY